MKSVYRLGDDLFIAVAFVSFVVGIVSHLLGINDLILGLTPRHIIFFSVICLLFSIALSLYDMNLQQK